MATRFGKLCSGVAAFVVIALSTLAGTDAVQAQPTAVMKLTPADYTEINQLYSAYSYALDTGNGPARIATFTPDGTMSSPLSKHVPYHMDQLLKNTMSYGQRERPGEMRHMLLNIHITPTAAGADGYCYALFPVGPPAADGSIKVMPGFYRDTLVKTAQGWRFKTKEAFYGNADIPPTTSRGSVEGTLTGK